MKFLCKLLTIATIVGLLILNSCTPKDGVTGDLSIKLTNGSWTFKSLTAKDKTTQKWYTLIYKNDVIAFNSNGTCTDKLGVLDGTGTWSLNSNQDILTVNISYGLNKATVKEETWKIKHITDTELVYDFSFNTKKIEMRYVH